MKLQIAMIDATRKAGCIAAVATSVDDEKHVFAKMETHYEASAI